MPNIEAIRDSWAKAWQGKDAGAFVALFTSDAVYRDDQAGRLCRGEAELRGFHEHFSAALSDVKFEWTSTFMSGSRGCLEWISSGRHTGSFHGKAPTGKSFKVPGVSVVSVTPDGLISECTDYYNGLLLKTQLGG